MTAYISTFVFFSHSIILSPQKKNTFAAINISEKIFSFFDDHKSEKERASEVPSYSCQLRQHHTFKSILKWRYFLRECYAFFKLAISFMIIVNFPIFERISWLSSTNQTKLKFTICMWSFTNCKIFFHNNLLFVRCPVKVKKNCVLYSGKLILVMQ